MLALTELPRKPYRDFDDYMQAIRRRSWNPSIRFPCMTCEGRKRIVAPGSYNDPVEGYKMADRINCPDCAATGMGREDAYRLYYRRELALWRGRRREAMRRREREKIILRKLTRAERALLEFV